MAGQPGVEPAGSLGESRELRVPRRKADAGADRGEVVEVAPQALELEQDRSHKRKLRIGRQAERVLARMRVRDAVRDGTGRTCAR